MSVKCESRIAAKANNMTKAKLFTGCVALLGCKFIYVLKSCVCLCGCVAISLEANS